MTGEADEGIVSRFRLRRETFQHGGFSVVVDLPVSSEDLIDEAEFERDERLPYWAELWPSARALARVILDEPELPPRAIELGCGIGLPSLALPHRRVDVLATDYYDDALRFARHNARTNGLGALRTRLLDWREPPADLPLVPLVIAADVLYEQRNAAALKPLLARVVQPGGRVLIADPRRVYLDDFVRAMQADGWAVRSLPDRREPAPAAPGREIVVKLFELRPPPAVSGDGEVRSPTRPGGVSQDARRPA